MASVRQKEGSSHWFACYKIPTGRVRPDGSLIFRRVQRSTGLEDKQRAYQVAISYELAAVAAGQKRWTELSAQRFMSELAALSGITAGQTEPTSQFMRRWLDARKREVAPKTFVLYNSRIRDFLKHIGSRENGPLSDISHSVVAGFRDAERASGKSAGTVNLSLTIIGQAFAEAVRLGLLTTNPATGSAIRGAKRSAQKRRAFTFQQFRKLVKACDQEWRTLVLVCGYTGARQQEAATLTWDQVDLKGKRLTLQRSKTDDAHWLPMHAALFAHFQKLKKRKGFVMPALAAMDGRALSKDFRTVILPKIGIVQDYAKTEGKGRTLAGYSLHSLRHSLSTWLNAAGVSELVRMRIVGHEDEQISRGYTHTELAQLSAELAKVPSV